METDAYANLVVGLATGLGRILGAMILTFLIGTVVARARGRKWMDSNWLIGISAVWALLPDVVRRSEFMAADVFGVGVWTLVLFGCRALWRKYRAAREKAGESGVGETETEPTGGAES